MSRALRRKNKANRFKKPMKLMDGWTQFSEALFVNDAGLIFGRRSTCSPDQDFELWILMDNNSKPVETFELPQAYASRTKRREWIIGRVFTFASKWLKENPIVPKNSAPKAQFCMDCGHMRTVADMCGCKRFISEPEGGHEMLVTIEAEKDGYIACMPAVGEFTDYILEIPFTDAEGFPEGEDMEEALDTKPFTTIKATGPVLRTALNRAKAHERAMKKIANAQKKMAKKGRK